MDEFLEKKILDNIEWRRNRKYRYVNLKEGK